MGFTPISAYTSQRLSRVGLSTENAKQNRTLPVQADRRSLAREFVGMYENFYHAALKRTGKQTSMISGTGAGKGITYAHFFRPGTPIYRLLTDSTCSVSLPRVVALIYLNIIVWDCESDPEVKPVTFVERVRFGMVEQGLDLAGSLELLVWLLMTDPVTRNVAEPERLWLLSRLLRCETQLSTELRARFDSALFQFLLAGESQHIPEDWTPGQFRADVMHYLSPPAQLDNLEVN